jgi:hypothetical protein
MKFQVGDRVRRIENPLNSSDRIVQGGEYVVSGIDDWGNPDPKYYSIKLDGHGNVFFDAWRFEYISPWAQACPCGVHWTECKAHQR